MAKCQQNLIGRVKLSAHQWYKDCMQRCQGKAPLVIATHRTAVIGLHSTGATFECRREGAVAQACRSEANADKLLAVEVNQQVGFTCHRRASGIDEGEGVLHRFPFEWIGEDNLDHGATCAIGNGDPTGGCKCRRWCRAGEVVDDDSRDVPSGDGEVRSGARHHFGDGVRTGCQREQADAGAAYGEYWLAVDLELGVAGVALILRLWLWRAIDRDDRAAVATRTEELEQLDLTRLEVADEDGSQLACLDAEGRGCAGGVFAQCIGAWRQFKLHDSTRSGCNSRDNLAVAILDCERNAFPGFTSRDKTGASQRLRVLGREDLELRSCAVSAWTEDLVDLHPTRCRCWRRCPSRRH